MPKSAPARAPITALPSTSTSSGFGSTVFDVLGDDPAARAAPASVFDVCHVGVVLRALVFVHAAVFTGLLFAAGNLAAWLSLAANGASVALPGVLLWLLAACACKRSLGRLPRPWQWAVVAAMGALSALFGSALAWLLSGDAGATPIAWLAPVCAGAGLALVLFEWLNLRAKALLPADTTARLAELQSRIRPHFLFNTLNTALALVRLDPARAEAVLEDLAELFRVAITESSEAVTLAEEVALAQRYLAIEQIRFGARLRVSWELDPDAGSAKVPPLLLQPLVENAVRHGVEPADAGGLIRVQTRVRLGRAVVSVTNSVPEVGSVPGHGMALRNVRERLRLMHDVGGQFEVSLKEGVFRVEIGVPL